MALFKILRGTDVSNSTNNPEISEWVHDGYAYFTPGDGKFYIDVDPDETRSKPIIGNYYGEQIQQEDGQLATANRICINQRLFNYNDYDILDCGTSIGQNTGTDGGIIYFNCGDSKVI